jgi:hypothetical protein
MKLGIIPSFYKATQSIISINLVTSVNPIHGEYKTLYYVEEREWI